jgi:hypothetical protein
MLDPPFLPKVHYELSDLVFESRVDRLGKGIEA